MTKMIKLSLVAAVAVAGLTTSVSAKPFAEAIKDVDVSGAISVGYNHYSTTETDKADGIKEETEYDLYMKATSKVNDTISFTGSIENDYATAKENTQNSQPIGQTGEVTDSDGDDVKTVGERSDLYVKEIYFTYANAGATVKAGKQGVGTPWTSSVRGDGLLATYGMGAVTLAGAKFNNTTLSGDSEVNAIAALGAAGPVKYEAWYLSATAATGISVAGKFAAGPANVNVRHTTLELDSAAPQDTFTLTKAVATMKVDGMTVTAGYGMTNDVKKGTLRSGDKAAGVALNKDNGESADLYMDQASLDNLNDATAIVLGVKMPVGAYQVGATYLVAEANQRDENDATTTYKLDVTELNICAKYTMSKNFNVSALYSAAEAKATGYKKTDDRMEVSLNYSF